MCRYYIVTWWDDASIQTTGVRFSWTNGGDCYEDAVEKLKERRKYMPWQNVEIVTKKQLNQLRCLYK